MDKFGSSYIAFPQTDISRERDAIRTANILSRHSNTKVKPTHSSNMYEQLPSAKKTSCSTLDPEARLTFEVNLYSPSNIHPWAQTTLWRCSTVHLRAESLQPSVLRLAPPWTSRLDPPLMSIRISPSNLQSRDVTTLWRCSILWENPYNSSNL